jgi:hypothetical protein
MISAGGAPSDSCLITSDSANTAQTPSPVGLIVRDSEIGVRDEKKERWRYGYIKNGRIIWDSLGHT